MRIVERLTQNDFNSDTAAKWLTTSKPWAFMAIGPESELDACIVENVEGAQGPIILSVERPIIARQTTNAKLRSLYHPFTDIEGAAPIGAKLDIVTYDQVPPHWSPRRSPRLYAQVTAALAVTERAVRTVPVFGARSWSVYLDNQDAAIVASYRLVGIVMSRAGVEDEYPISPTGYPVGTPTYNTLAADSHIALHLDNSIDDFDAVRLYVKSASGTPSFRDKWRVRD